MVKKLTTEVLKQLLADNNIVIPSTTKGKTELFLICLLYTSPSPRDRQKSRMPSSA